MQLHSKNAKSVVLTLMHKKTGYPQEFSVHNEKKINFANNPVITGFDMTKLEVEYDYDTDIDQLRHSHSMLLKELSQAIDFYVKEDPLKLVDNVRMRWATINLSGLVPTDPTDTGWP